MLNMERAKAIPQRVGHVTGGMSDVKSRDRMGHMTG